MVDDRPAQHPATATGRVDAGLVRPPSAARSSATIALPSRLSFWANAAVDDGRWTGALATAGPAAAAASASAVVAASAPARNS